MKILIFSQYYYPEQFLINEISEELVKRGNQVTVVTGLPNYPVGKIFDGYRNKTKREETVNGVRVIRCPIIPRGKNKVQLILNYLSYMYLAKRYANRTKEQYDVVFLYQLTPILQIVPAKKYCHQHGLKLFMYNCDLAPMSGERTLKKIKPALQWYRRFSKKLVNSCDMIGVTSKSFLDYNHSVNGVPLEKMVYLSQHASDVMLNLDIKAEDNGVADFMFAGNIGKAQSIETIVQAAEILAKERTFRIHMVGGGSMLDELKAMVKRKHLDDFFLFHGRHDMSEMPKFYQLADALLITLRPGQVTVPCKLQTYMTTGKPVFGAMDSSGYDIISESGCGACTKAGDAQGLAELMRSYIDKPEQYSECGENGKRFFKENYTKDVYMDKLIAILTQLSTHQ